jgi:ribosome biogenesis GTPase
MTGIVFKSTGSWYWVKTEEGMLQCRIKGKLRLAGIKSTNPVAVGDVVKFEYEDDEKERGVITGIEDRKNYIVRKSVNLSKRTHIIAANLDQAVLIVTLSSPKTYPQFIDRFLVTAEAYSVPTVIVFNKIDLYGEEELDDLEFYSFVYEQAGYKVLCTSAKDQVGLEDLMNLLKDKTSLLSGHSGVGKSTLVNQIQPDLSLKTNAISESHAQGQHTTTFAEMFDLSFGGAIVDTPGIKGFGLVNMEKEEIGDYFPEIFKLKSECKFHNCLHLEEPGCAIKDAVENNQLSYTRYESYVQLIQDVEEGEHYRNDQYI